MLPPDPDSSTVASLTEVTVEFAGRVALQRIDLDIRRGRLTVITGTNGAGKSTLLDVIGRIRRPSAGRAHVTATSTALVPQRAGVSDALPMTARDIVTIGAWGRAGRWRRVDGAARRAVDAAMDALALEAMRRTPFAELSGGQRQRVLLAQGLARGADLLLLDEPTTGLDVESTRRIHAAFASELARGATLVCVSHDAAVIAAADRVVRLDDGRIVSDTGRHAGGRDVARVSPRGGRVPR